MRPPPLPWRAAAVARHLATLAADATGATHTPQARGPFATLTGADLAAFREVVGGAGMVTEAAGLEKYNRDWTGKYTGAASLVLRPSTTLQAAALLAHCASRRIAVVPQGGNTGLVGGGVPVHDEVIISTDRMTGVTGVDTEAGTVSARAGTTLADVDAAAAAAGMAVPLDLGARASCAIGGNVATNAGGARLVRYGSLRSTVLGLEAVLPSGAVLDLTRPLRKDNTGLDLKQLFIGSEGTLGLITAVTLATPPRPPRPSLALLACPSWAAVRDVLGLARRTLGEALAAAEFMDAPAVGVACARLAPSVRHPLPASAAPYFVLLEAAGVDGAHDAAKMEALLERALASGAAVDGVRADTDAQAAALWAVREGVPIALARAGTLFKYDVSLAVRDMEAVVGECRARVAAVAAAAAAPPAPAPTVVAFGHLGDGNLHLNVSVPAPTPGIAAALEPWVYERVAAAAGSGSAEHGVGIAKRAYLHLSKPAAAVEAMRGVKRVFDPDGIMNPYKVF